MKHLFLRAVQLFTALLLLLIAFVLGLVLRPTLDNALFPPKVSVTGTVQRMVYTPDLAGASALPPEGLYVESSAVERVYVRCKDAEAREGKNVRVVGTLDSVCGPTLTCHPWVTGECGG